MKPNGIRRLRGNLEESANSSEIAGQYIGNQTETAVFLREKVTAAFVESVLEKIILPCEEYSDFVVVDGGITDIDITGLQVLLSLHEYAKSRQMSWSLRLPTESLILKAAARAGLEDRFCEMPITAQ